MSHSRKTQGYHHRAVPSDVTEGFANTESLTGSCLVDLPQGVEEYHDRLVRAVEAANPELATRAAKNLVAFASAIVGARIASGGIMSQIASFWVRCCSKSSPSPVDAGRADASPALGLVPEAYNADPYSEAPMAVRTDNDVSLTHEQAERIRALLSDYAAQQRGHRTSSKLVHSQCQRTAQEAEGLAAHIVRSLYTWN